MLVKDKPAKKESFCYLLGKLSLRQNNNQFAPFIYLIQFYLIYSILMTDKYYSGVTNLRRKIHVLESHLQSFQNISSIMNIMKSISSKKTIIIKFNSVNVINTNNLESFSFL